ncbi:4-oxalocrotonate decarboxylase [Gordonia sp. TBRC 11910]|uniref:4-oxalocrotonate decarboxylase n=1 Tax=Gordonia asplenii TaxID=2725283 RepID=A0A848L205_9ACTN|nr:fumarylacetoacetate hydrolase family protein [Gordonia asplenii]NMO04472.1 4-oxalocrotonate decarboxylase [Gordonia asplenii]
MNAVVDELDAARSEVRPIDQFAGRVQMSLDDAYAALLGGIDRRRGRGERVVGLKLGFTSAEKAAQMGVSDVILGVLTDQMRIADGGLLDHDSLIHPRVEPEVAFRLSPDVPAAVLGAADQRLLPYVTHVAAALEVIDSRYRNFSFSLEDVVADNTSGSHFAVGEWHEFAGASTTLDVSDLAVELRIDDAVAASGSTGAILGDPVESLVAAKRLASRHGHPVEPGFVILAGSATAAVALPPDATVRVDVAGLGAVTIRTSEH